MLQKIPLLSPCIIFSRILILSLIDKLTTQTQSLGLFIWNIAPVVKVASVGLDLLTSGVLDISDITQYLDHVKSSSIARLIKGKSRDSQKLVKYFNGRTTSAFNLLLLFGVLSIIFVWYFLLQNHLRHLYNNFTNFLMS